MQKISVYDVKKYKAMAYVCRKKTLKYNLKSIWHW